MGSRNEWFNHNIIGKSLRLSLGASALCADVILHHFVVMKSSLSNRERTEGKMLEMNNSYFTLIRIHGWMENNLSNEAGR